jgi:arginyl-tRNA--protein-N-Asp/Glu arginylyltransferase
MKIFYEEMCHSYQTYSFGYKILLDLEPGDSLVQIYEMGFLPYSGNIGVNNRFYLARSARVPLTSFILSSENRRVMKKFDNVFTVRTMPAKALLEDEKALAFCLDYFKERHGDEVMSRERLIHILSTELNTTVAEYITPEGKVIAYVIENGDDKTGHFWFSFYDLSYVFQSLGMWLMIERVLAAQKAGKTHYYLGTVYGEKALYKTNFQNLEYWQGSEWSTALADLKASARTDADRVVSLKQISSRV